MRKRKEDEGKRKKDGIKKPSRNERRKRITKEEETKKKINKLEENERSEGGNEGN